MMNLYGKAYAGNQSEFIGTLFDPNGTANGFYKVAKTGVYLLDMQDNERAFIRRDGVGPVTVTRTPCGKRRFMFSTTGSDRAWLGVPESYMAEIDGAKALANCAYGMELMQ